MIRNNAHLEKETTVRTEFGGPDDRNALASGLVEGKTLKCAHLHLPPFRLVHQVSDWCSGVAIKMGRRQGATKEHIWIDT